MVVFEDGVQALCMKNESKARTTVLDPVFGYRIEREIEECDTPTCAYSNGISLPLQVLCVLIIGKVIGRPISRAPSLKVVCRIVQS